jgi:hypothetical protein
MLFSYTPRTLVNILNPRKVEIESSHSKPAAKPKQSTAQELAEPSKPLVKYNVGDKVLYRNHFKELVRWIPAIILQKLSPLTYLININGNVRMVQMNQIRHSDLSDEFHPSIPVIQFPSTSQVDQLSEDTNQVDQPASAGGSQRHAAATQSRSSPTNKKKKSSMRRRSESKRLL